MGLEDVVGTVQKRLFNNGVREVKEAARRVTAGAVDSTVGAATQIVRGAVGAGTHGVLEAAGLNGADKTVSAAAATMAKIGQSMAGKEPLALLTTLDRSVRTGGKGGLTQENEDKLLAANLAQRTGLKMEDAQVAVKAYRDNPKITPADFNKKIDEMKRAGTAAQPSMMDNISGAIGALTGGAGANLYKDLKGGPALSADEKEALDSFAKAFGDKQKPTVEQLAKMANEGKLSKTLTPYQQGKVVQDLINYAGADETNPFIQLPDVSTIGRQKPTPVETRVPTPVDRQVSSVDKPSDADKLVEFLKRQFAEADTRTQLVGQTPTTPVAKVEDRKVAQQREDLSFTLGA